MSVAVVIPAKDEPGRHLGWLANRLPDGSCVVVVVDSDDDTTPMPSGWQRVIQPGYGPGSAVLHGLRSVPGCITVVATMCADGSDDPSVLAHMIRAIEDGAVLCCASRYSPGGARAGGPRLKDWLTRFAAWWLRLAGCPVADPTNLYRAYDTAWLRAQDIRCTTGFAVSLELAAKATAQGVRVVNVPVTWRDRTEGRSHWRWSWLGVYGWWWLRAMVASVVRRFR
jgi:hypothetical protein